MEYRHVFTPFTFGNVTVKNRGEHMLLQDANLELYPGEILGIAGVEGNGQNELVELIFNLRKGVQGEVEFDSVVVSGGVRPCVAEAETFFGTAPEFYVVGDAQITRAHGMNSQMLLNTPNKFITGSMRYANFSAFMAANNI